MAVWNKSISVGFLKDFQVVFVFSQFSDGFLFFETRCKLDVACSCEPLQRTWIGGSDFLKTRNRRFGFLQQWEFPGDFLYNEMNSPQLLSHKKNMIIKLSEKNHFKTYGVPVFCPIIQF